MLDAVIQSCENLYLDSESESDEESDEEEEDNNNSMELKNGENKQGTRDQSHYVSPNVSNF